MKNAMNHSGFIYQGYIKRKITKKLTVKEWSRFNRVFTKKVGDSEYYLDLQEYLCKKYNIILTDYKVKRSVNRKYEKEIGSRIPLKMKTKIILKKFNQQNFDKGMKTFNDGIENFTKELDNFGSAFGDKKTEKTTKEFLGISGKNPGKNPKLWSNKKQFTKIWSEKPTKQKRSRRGKSRHEQNMEKIWGKKKR